MSDLWPGLDGPAIRYISEAPSEAWRHGVRRLVLLGSTGSIGGNTLAAIRSRRRECEVLGLSCARNIKTLAGQAQEFRPPYLAVLDEASAAGLRKLLPTGYTPEILVGSQGYARLAALPPRREPTPQEEARLTPELLYQFDGQLQTTGAVR